MHTDKLVRKGEAAAEKEYSQAKSGRTAAEKVLAENLNENMRELAHAITRVLESASPLPGLEETLSLFERYPYLRRGYGAQIMHAEKTGEYTYLLGEVRFQLQRVLHILKRQSVI
jgi:hypothetical protein